MSEALVCVDGSNYAASCCGYAAWLGKRLGMGLHVVYVTDLRQFEVPFVADLSGSLGIQPFQAVMGQLQAIEEKKAEAVLGQAKKSLREAGFAGQMRFSHETGFLVDCLKDLEQAVDLVIIGKRGENANFATDHLGSTMERVARASKLPCLVASRAFREPKRALFAYQDNDSCQRALDYIKSSPLLAGLELHLVTVSHNEEEGEALRSLRSAEGTLAEAGTSPVCQMLHGSRSDAIARYAKENKIDLLVMGAYGHTRIRHLIIGSTTTEMLLQCQLPTLLFR